MLSKIITQKKIEVAKRKEQSPIKVADWQKREPGFFKRALIGKGISLIAEVKKASPSKGVLVENFAPGEIASCYERSGAAAISVLTDERFFQGSLDYLREIRKKVKIPLLQKDFILDPFQIYEASLLGADGILLIVGILDDVQLKEFLLLSQSLGLDALVEVHNRAELERALKVGGEIIGINNRNLKTFKTNLNTTRQLAPLIPSSKIVVSESGISTPDDVAKVAKWGVDGILVGEALVVSNNREKKVKELMGVE